MPQDNVEITRAYVEAWDSGDLSAWAEGLHEDIEWVPLAENTQVEPIRGHEAVLAFVRDWIEPWESYKVEATRIVEVGDKVVMSTRQTGKHPSGAEVTMEMHGVATHRDGKLIRMVWFMDEPAALKAAGQR